jgi:hypothetical protein
LDLLYDTCEVREELYWYSPASRIHFERCDFSVYGAYFDGREFPSHKLINQKFWHWEDIHKYDRIIDFEAYLSHDAFNLIKKDLAPFLVKGVYCTDKPLDFTQAQNIIDVLKRRIELLNSNEFTSHQKTGYWFDEVKQYHRYRTEIMKLLTFVIETLDKIIRHYGQVHINFI